MLVHIHEVFNAVEHDELIPCFQPIVELKTGRIVGFEVLARWHHPQHGLVLPKNFIPLAESNGLIGHLTQQVLRKAFLALPLLPDPLFLAVNISPVQLHDLTLPHQIQTAADLASFPLHRLHIEITESAFVDNVEQAHTITSALKEMGCKLALDDFGTGYSSLLHLQAMPFDKLKVDRSFVSSMTTKRESRKIVAAVVGLGLSLGLSTVAEGVETQEQADMLILLGCEMGQGWFYGKPLPADSLPQTIAAAADSLPARWLDNRESIVASLEAHPSQRLAQLQAIYDGAPVGLCFLDPKYRYVSINQRFAALNGTPVAAHIGRTMKEVVPEVFPIVEPFLVRAFNGEKVIDVELQRPSYADGGNLITILASYQPAFDEAGEVVGVSVSVVDITERKRNEDDLRDSDDHHRHMAEINHQVPWVLDATGKSVAKSKEWERLNLFSKSEDSKMAWFKSIKEDSLEPTLAMLEESLRTGKPIDIEYEAINKDGTSRRLRSRGSPRFDANGKIVRWYGTVEDIESTKRATIN